MTAQVDRLDRIGRRLRRKAKIRIQPTRAAVREAVRQLLVQYQGGTA